MKAKTPTWFSYQKVTDETGLSEPIVTVRKYAALFMRENASSVAQITNVLPAYFRLLPTMASPGQRLSGTLR
jgi:hypothetical protein